MALSFIKSSGNIISEDFCRELAVEAKADYVKDKSFGDQVKKIDEQIAIDFEHLRNRWEEIRIPLLNHEMDLPTLRDKWIKPLFKVLGFDLHINRGYIHNDANNTYDIRHSGWNDTTATIIHLVKTGADLDSRDPSNAKHPNKSPQDTVQSYLNTTKHSWAVISNGLKIRVLRDFYHSITKGFLEFDVEAIFENASSEQFRVLYRICHRSRFEGQFKSNDPQIEFDEEGNEMETSIDKCLLEKFHEKSRETGIKVGNKLRDQVITTIETLGSGFTEHLDSSGWDDKQVKAYYAEILNLIYRFLFLLFAEQKGWLPVQNEVYARTYSLNALREFAERGDYSSDEETDLWEGLKITFELVARGYQFPNGDKINAFGGQLFSEKKIQTLAPLPLANKHLLKAMDALCYFEEDKLRNRINYTTLAIDELGSVYESLLDFTPRIAQTDLEIVLGETKKKGKVEQKIRHINKGEFFLDTRGTDRKTTGSYYTDSRLVAQLIESALVPVIENSIDDKNSAKEKEAALLDLKVADIACGSGAFLIAALEKLGEQLALIRKGDEEKPTDDQLREAKRDVLLHCIYGVDLNPMALELAKFSLWITASLPDMPLTFLDHKLKCGNSLIGATPELIEKGIHEDAYKPVGNDNPAICAKLKADAKRHLDRLSKVNEPSAQYGLAFERSDVDELLRLREGLNNRKQEEVIDVELVEEEFHQLEKMERQFKDWLKADVWTAAFFIEKTEIDLDLYPTNITLENLKENQPVSEELVRNVIKVSDQYKFFHFHLEFPEIFEKGGFDCLLGNPPWEKLQVEDKKFFKGKNDAIIEADAILREELIDELKVTDLELYKSYISEQIFLLRTVHFLKLSERFKLSSLRNVNTYLVFAENYIRLLNQDGYAAIITPSGIATDDTSKDLFRYFIENKLLKSLFDFENNEKIFDIHRSFKFSLLTLSKKTSIKTIDLLFFATNPNHIHEEYRHYSLSSDEFLLINPNTSNCPVFRNKYDAKIVLKIYAKASVIHNELSCSNEYGWNAWQMVNDTHEKKILQPFQPNNKDVYGAYEGKLFFQYDHRYSNYIAGEFISNTDYSPQFISSKRYSIDKAVIDHKIEKNGWKQKWQITFRLVCRATDNRTFIASVIPRSGTMVSAPTVVINDYNNALILISNLNCFAFDYVVRTKIGGTALNHFIVKQLPLVPLSKFTSNVAEKINEKTLNLIYTSIDLKAFAKDFDLDSEPFSWNDKERFQLQCELDAIYAHLYGLDKEEVDYILETFPIVKRKDIDKYGKYHTKETILQLYDEFSWVRDEMQQQVIKTTE